MKPGAVQLVELDGVRCRIMFLKGDGAERAAKLGDDVIFGVPHDSVYFVGKARAYTTVVGKTSHYIPLVKVTELIALEDVRKLIAPELSRRDNAVAAQLASTRNAATAVAEKRQLQMEEQKLITKRRNLSALRRTFRDQSGKFTVDATCVAFDGSKVSLVRMVDRKRVEVALQTLSREDQEWVRSNSAGIQAFGHSTEEFIQKEL